MRIGLIQQHVTRNREDNIARGIEALEEVVSQGAQLIAYPELAFDFFLPQYPATPESLELAETIPGPTTEIFCEKAKELKAVVILNLFERERDRTMILLRSLMLTAALLVKLGWFTSLRRLVFMRKITILLKI